MSRGGATCKKYKMAKIAFIGTHGTGKTTLVNELVFNLRTKGVNALAFEEIARGCPLPINENATKETQLWIITRQISTEIEKEKNYELVVCDRSVLDTYCYHEYFFGREKNWESFIQERMKSYDRLIFVPIRDNFLKDDGIRSMDRNFQRSIDSKIKERLSEFGLRYINFDASTIDNLCKIYSNRRIVGEQYK